MKLRYWLSVSFASLVFISLQAQIIQGGVAFGKPAYWGDLNSPNFSTNISKNGTTALQLFLKRNLNTQMGVKLALTSLKIKADDANSDQIWQLERNLDFKSNVFEASITGEYYLFGFDPFTNEKPFSPYITAGIVGGYFNPKTTYKGTEYELQPLGTEGQGIANFPKKYSKYFVGVPFGGGAILKINRAFDISLDIIARKLSTDYLDDISGSYVNYNELKTGNGELSALLADRTNEYLGVSEPLLRSTGSQRGGSTIGDWYFTFMINLGFTIAEGDTFIRKRRVSTSNCPKF